MKISQLYDPQFPDDEQPLSPTEVETIQGWVTSGAGFRNSEATDTERLNQHVILPILQLRCTVCHGRQTQQAGRDQSPTDSYGRRCLIARRLVERGVRFVQLFLDFQPFDHHGGLEKGLRSCCARTDQPIAALLKDLKVRGLPDRTLVIWGGEFAPQSL